jgi:hypothetical protein
MIATLALAAALFGQQPADAPGGAQSVPPKNDCSPAVPDPNSREIVVCAPKPEGYRIDPDVLAAKKAKRQALAGRPKPPENFKDHSCTVVGSAPCMDAPMINLLAAAATAAEMAKRLSTGQEIGSMFVTDPQMTEYQYYQQAKKEREAKEAAKKAAAAKAGSAAAPVSEAAGGAASKP